MGQDVESDAGWMRGDALRVWDLLTGLIDFGDRLDFVLLQLPNLSLETPWRGALEEYCGTKNLPFVAPQEKTAPLGWLEEELVVGAQLDSTLGAARPRSVYWVSLVGLKNERFILARLNENRDRLVSALGGAFCLVGVGDFVRRVAHNAPSIWAMRARAFVLDGPPPSGAQGTAEMESAVDVAPRAADIAPPAAPSPAAAAPPPTQRGYESAREGMKKNATLPDFAVGSVEVLISACPQDVGRAKEIQTRLPGRVSLPVNPGDAEMLFNRCDLILPLLSPAYLESVEWKILEKALERDRNLESKLIPLLIVSTPVPAALRTFTPLRLLNADEEADNVPRLMDTIQRLGRDVPSTQRDRAPPGVLSNVKIQLNRPLDWSQSGPEQLTRYLAVVYPDWSTIRAISQLAGISLYSVFFQSSPLLIWADVLNSASRQSKLRDLVGRVLRDERAAPIHAKLRELTDI